MTMASTRSGAPRSPSCASRTGLNCWMNTLRTWRFETSATSNPGRSTCPTPSNVTSALTISTISTGKNIRYSAPRLTDSRISCPSEKVSKFALRRQRLEISATSRRNPAGSPPRPGSATAER